MLKFLFLLVYRPFLFREFGVWVGACSRLGESWIFFWRLTCSTLLKIIQRNYFFFFFFFSFLSFPRGKRRGRGEEKEKKNSINPPCKRDDWRKKKGKKKKKRPACVFIFIFFWVLDPVSLRTNEKKKKPYNFKKRKTTLQLVTVDVSAPTSMKNAAKCDT